MCAAQENATRDPGGTDADFLDFVEYHRD